MPRPKTVLARLAPSDLSSRPAELERTLSSKAGRDSIVNVQDKVGTAVKNSKAQALHDRCIAALGSRFGDVYAFLSQVCCFAC